jgi:NAD(P)-dependent dehydrogenase (short-subunit alcohol dehydrogenase family)
MPVPGRVADKVSIVTGGASGIGEASARRLAEEGARVVVADIDAAGAEAVAASIVEAGGNALSVEVDVSDADAVAAMVERTLEAYGRLDVLHNNAALTNRDFVRQDVPLADLDLAVWDRMLAVNLRGCVAACKFSLPAMIESGGGSIINTSSVAGSFGDVALTAYGVSKAGINALTKYVATQYGKQGVRCNALLPVAIRSPRLDAVYGEEWRTMMSENVLTPRLGSPEDTANAALFLASDESAYITGQLISVDGGWSAHTPRYAQALRNGLLAPGGRQD